MGRGLITSRVEPAFGLLVDRMADAMSKLPQLPLRSQKRPRL